MDVIRNLPEHLVYSILGRLPIGCPFRTCYLKRKWWYMLHNSRKIKSITSENTQIQPFIRIKFEKVDGDSMIEKLNLSDKISVGYGQTLHGSFNSWERLTLYDINFRDFEQITAVFSLIRNSPNLKELHIEGSSPANTDQRDQVLSYWEEQQRDSCSWRQLSAIKIGCIGDYCSPLYLIKLLLAGSPVLDKLTYKIHDEDAKQKHHYYIIVRLFMHFRRASPRAQVILKFLNLNEP